MQTNIGSRGIAYRRALLSFIPSTIIQWNNLPQHIKNTESKSHFKSLLRKEILNTNIHNNIFTNCGNRSTNILHCRLRNRASSLNYDLFSANLVPDPVCQCGFACEDIYHYFFNCPNFHNQRITLLNELQWYNNISLETFMYGDPNLDDNLNNNLCQSIQKYISATNRFS